MHEQGGLAGARLAREDEGGAAAEPAVTDQVERVGLAVEGEQVADGHPRGAGLGLGGAGDGLQFALGEGEQGLGVGGGVGDGLGDAEIDRGYSPQAPGVGDGLGPGTVEGREADGGRQVIDEDMVGGRVEVAQVGRDGDLVGRDALGVELREGGGDVLMLGLVEVGRDQALGEREAVADETTEQVPLGVEVGGKGHAWGERLMTVVPPSVKTFAFYPSCGLGRSTERGGRICPDRNAGA